MKPIDHHDRQRAAEDLEHSYALTAGAGTGKTRTLVERIVRLLAAGVPPEEIGVVTFTEAATQELRARIRKELDRAHAGADDEARAGWAQAIARVDRLTVVTLHAFALDLLRREALDAGFAPDVEIASELTGASAATRAFDAWYRSLPSDVVLAMCSLASRSKLRTAMQEALRLRDLEPVMGPEDVDWAALGRAGRGRARDLVDAAQACTAPDTCKLYGSLADFVEAFGGLPADDAACAHALLDHGPPPINKRAGSAKHWPGDAKAEVRAAFDRLEAWLEEGRIAALAPLHRRLVGDLFEVLPVHVAEAKAEQAQVDYDDLLFSAVALIRASPAARRRLAARFRHLLVDEVQDTDPLQAEIVARLRSPKGEGEWSDLDGPRAHLFAVGDPKQSIYRFRRADVGTWRTLADWIAKRGQRAELTQAFRSVPGIIQLVNHVFADMPDFSPLEPARDPVPLDPVVILDGDDTEAVVRHLVELRRSEAEVWDPDAERLRRFDYGDAMVLLPTWSKANEVQDALTLAGVPSIVEGGRWFFERDEIRLAVAALRAVDEPQDHEAVVFALRGLFGCSHQDLADHVAAGGYWTPTAPPPPGSPCTTGLRLFGELHRKRDGRTWIAILDRILAETRATAVWRLRSNGMAALANLDKLRELLRQLEAVSASPSETVERLRALGRSKDEDLSVRDPDAQAVRITTIFKAKGREAPVVILAHAERKKDSVVAAVDRAANQVALRIGDLLPPGWAEHEARERQEQAEERARWMYVAMTRPRDQLVLCWDDEKVDKGKHLAPSRLTDALGAVGARSHDEVVQVGEGAVRIRKVAELPAPPCIEETFPGQDARVDAGLEAAAPPAREDGWAAARRNAIRAAEKASTKWVTVTELVKPRRVTKSGIGARGGQLVHKVMEALDLSKPPEALGADVPGWLAVFAPQLGASAQERGDAEAVLRRLVHHEVLERARAAPEVWKETPFAYPRPRAPNTMVAGVIDLCFPLDAARTEWVVVDWKSDAPQPGDAVHEAYRRQLAFYAEAIIANRVGHDVRVVDQVLAGPPPELAEDPETSALDEVLSDLAPGLEALLDAGAPPPAVDPLFDDVPVEGTVEMWFEAAKVALLVGQPEPFAAALEARGLTVVRADDEAPGWADAAIQAVAAALGLELAQEAADTAEEEDDE